MKWLLIGEALNNDGIMIYQGVWDYTAPLSIFVYKWLHFVFGKSRWVYFILSMILVIFQAGVFNNVMLKNKAYNSNTYVPALIYVIVMNMFFDLFTLSPALLSMTFLLLAINNLFKRMDNQTKDELFIYTGIYLGLAVILYIPSIFFLFVTLFALIIYTGSILRRVLLLVYGFVLVLVVTYLYFYWNDSADLYWTQVFDSIWTISSYSYLSSKSFWLMATIPLAWLIVSLYQIFRFGKYVNIQSRIQFVMLMFIAAGVLGMLVAQDRTTFQLILIIPSLAFFVTHNLLLIKNWIVAEATFVLFFGLIILNCLFPLKGWWHVDQFIDLSQVVVKESPYEERVAGKKLWYIGDDLSIYQNAQLATPYLDWQLSKRHLTNLDYYDTVEKVFQNINNDLPQVIVDEKGVIESLFQKMPTIQMNYRHSSSHEGVYYLIK